MASQLEYYLDQSLPIMESKFIKLNVPVIVMIIYGTLVTLLLTSLTIYHGTLICNNKTTQEEMRAKYEAWGSNPYNRGAYSRQNF